MDAKKERSYAKESTKTTPSGIRFDIEKLAFVQKRENLPTKQKVVDFLLNKYWWEHKTAVPTEKEAPPLALKVETVQDEPLSFDALKSQINPVTVGFKSFEQWQREKRECETEEQWEEIKAGIKAATNLTQKQKDLLIKYS